MQTAMQDVLYLRNGGVLRGTLEDDGTTSNRLRIRTRNGLRIVSRRDVERMAREAPPPEGGASPVHIELTLGASLPLPSPASPASPGPGPTPPPARKNDRPPANNALTLGTYALTITGPVRSDTYRGGTLGYERALGDHWAVRFAGYTASYEFNDQETFDGYDVQLLLTTNARRTGFKFYLGGAYFTETYAVPPLAVEERFSGGGLVLGLGYNWRRVSLEWYGVGRMAEDYRLTPQNHVIDTGSLAVGLRF